MDGKVDSARCDRRTKWAVKARETKRTTISRIIMGLVTMINAKQYLLIINRVNEEPREEPQCSVSDPEAE